MVCDSILQEVKRVLSRADLMSMTDLDIVRLCETSPSLTDTPLAREISLPPVYILASNILVKVGPETHLRESEAKATVLVRERTTIPVPTIYRFFRHDGFSYLVLEYVHGDTLDACWDDLSNWQKLRIAFTLRNYVRQLRRIRTPQTEKQVPGPITDDPSHPLPCYTPALGEYRVDAFASYNQLRDWMNGRYRVTERLHREHVGWPPFDDSEPLVFVHGDLCLRNIILGTDNRVWLIDFGCAGVYPCWFEAWGSRDSTLFKPPKLWNAARKIAIGDYEAQEGFDGVCQYAFSYGLALPDPGER
ncbi:kinase-like domain-containing protein [Trametes maxima]|nr:kinase-like domain-containing protein [Trametes maxima]